MMSTVEFLRDTFPLVVTIDILSTLMFLGRVHWPRQAKVFGHLALLMGIPAFILVIAGASSGLSAAYWSMPLIYAAFCVFALFLDVILKIEFRRPRRLALLIPFLILYFVPLMGMWGMLWGLDLVRWAITGLLYFAMVGSSIYAARNGFG